ncbi:uncharacterized protein LOC113316257 [Papaver somniferum]|uniref:uncharacterized protein LOC113316257 n=1 Tax=Papaver somniferum TaxID=3469 RepID=UPI000E701198|nr:uncharacterized protein LOC113316257 [Papaver somniferum]
MINDEQTTLNKITKINLCPLFEGYYINGSCYGLISVIGWNADFYICNPVTKEFLILPEVDKILLPEVKRPFECVLSGFGYLPLSNEYKAVRIIQLGKDPNVEHVVEVYTLGSEDGYVVAFDLADEKFSEIPPLPIPSVYDLCPLFSLGVLGGFLYCAKHEIPVDFDHEIPVETNEMSVEIWVLKKNKGNCEVKDSEEHQPWSWSKEFNGVDFKPLALMRSGAVLLSNGTGLFSYDRNSSCSKMLVNYDESIKGAIPYIKTLVSLNALGEKDTKTMDQRE